MKKRGYALPLSLCVAGVTLMLGLSAAQMTNGDLGLANHQYYQERARQAADFGLEFCVSHQVKPGLVLAVPSQSGTHPFDSVTVKVYSHGEAGSPMQVPQGFEYWVAEGRASEHQNSNPLATARVGALVRYGLPSGTAGAQVRSLHVNHSGPVDFQVMDGLARRPVLGESVCSSEFQGVGDYFSFPGQNHAIELGTVGAFGGSFRVPKGVDQSVVHFNTSNPMAPSIPISQDGGPINIPTFTPPAGLPMLGVENLPNNFTGLLPPGRYARLDLPSDATVTLRGTYQFDKLVSHGQATLKVASNTSAKVFVGDIELAQGRLGLTNENSSAQSFRFTVRASQPAANAPPSPVLNFKMVQGGGVALVADGHHVRLASDASREIRGAFSADALELNFEPPSSPGLGLFVRNPVFVYDVSASTARRPKGPGGGLGAGNGPTDENFNGNNAGNIGNAGNAGNSGNTDGAGQGESSYQGDGLQGGTNGTGPDGGGPQGFPGSGIPGGSPILSRPAGVEPMILSRQSL